MQEADVLRILGDPTFKFSREFSNAVPLDGDVRADVTVLEYGSDRFDGSEIARFTVVLKNYGISDVQIRWVHQTAADARVFFDQLLQVLWDEPSVAGKTPPTPGSPYEMPGGGLVVIEPAQSSNEMDPYEQALLPLCYAVVRGSLVTLSLTYPY